MGVGRHSGARLWQVGKNPEFFSNDTGAPCRGWAFPGNWEGCAPHSQHHVCLGALPAPSRGPRTQAGVPAATPLPTWLLTYFNRGWTV